MGVAFGCSLLLHVLALALIQVPAPAYRSAANALSVLLAVPAAPIVAPQRPPSPPQEKKAKTAPPRSAIGVAAPPPAADSTERPRSGAPLVAAFAVSPPRPLPRAGAAGSADPRRLTRLPRLARPLGVEYPQRALAARERATVVFQLLIDETGRVVEALPLTDAAPDFIDAAAAALRGARFAPGEIGGAPVRARAYFAVSFDLE